MNIILGGIGCRIGIFCSPRKACQLVRHEGDRIGTDVGVVLADFDAYIFVTRLIYFVGQKTEIGRQWACGPISDKQRKWLKWLVQLRNEQRE